MSEIRELEFSLRRLTGVAAVGFEHGDEGTVVHVLVEPHVDGQYHEVRHLVAEAVRQHFQRPAVVEVGVIPDGGRPRAPRVQVLAVRRDTADGVEIHLAHRGRRTVGRATTMSPGAAAAATVDALTRLGADVPFRVDAMHGASDGGPVVVLAHSDREDCRQYGVASGRSPEDAACRAALHALNRYLERDGVFTGSPAATGR